jgi:hypothetical protein
MEAGIYRGKVSFVNYEKEFATIDYEHNNKEKSVNFKTTSTGKKQHHFRVGDVVTFELKLSDRGDKMTAFNVNFIHNPLIEVLIQKAQKENRFSGYGIAIFFFP